MAIEPIGPTFGHGKPWTIIPAMASGNHQRPPDQLSKHYPQLKGNSLIPPCTPTKSHNYNANFKGGFFNSSVWQSMAAIRQPFKDPNHLALQELGWKFHSGLF
ncbi:hypothetical protein O181_121363 [Austropuccinia psidii MF-1]|uniref:Uncharacterized protein n=1 Tax=Austropuccinia psidii MF-1 TaxID=1389203 RepID=A0A9Q3KHT9_9BASI|nr:hypothetical protein [Austropuccinia psidii MF-1]